MFTASPAAWIFVAYLQNTRPPEVPRPVASLPFWWHQGSGHLTRTACFKFSNTQIVGKLNENILRLAFDWGIRQGRGGEERDEAGAGAGAGLQTATLANRRREKAKPKARKQHKVATSVTACRFFFFTLSFLLSPLTPLPFQLFNNIILAIR